MAPELTVDDRERVARLAERVRAPLADARTALAAVTHKSWVNEHRDEGYEDNERLEFLGDAVIDLLVSEYLMTAFPEAREGDLSKLRAAVVDEPGLASMARALELGELLRLGRGEELTGGRSKASLLADAMEAVVAAVFLDGGLAGVHRLVDPFLQEAYARASSGKLDRDFKTQLQEQGQARYRSSPRYRVVAEIGPDHLKTFEIEVELRGAVLGRGSGRSKKDAEQAAARVAVEALAAMAPEPAAAPAAPPPAAMAATGEEGAPLVRVPGLGAPAAVEPAAPPVLSSPVPPPGEAPPPGRTPARAGKSAPRPRKPAKGSTRPAKGKAAAAKAPARPAPKKGAPGKAGARPARKIAVARGRD